MATSFTPINPRPDRQHSGARPTWGQATPEASSPTSPRNADMFDRSSRGHPPSSAAEPAQPHVQAAEIDTGVEAASVLTPSPTPPSEPVPRAARKPLPTRRPPTRAAPVPAASTPAVPRQRAADTKNNKTSAEKNMAMQIQREGVIRDVACKGCAEREANISKGRRRVASDVLLPCTSRSDSTGACARCKFLKEKCEDQEEDGPPKKRAKKIK
ncbi:hypothetical protein B0H67DRAFT_57729 [Lasiosphaeris hirsuta]|uniref:Uncharacterized protein n=1 Tax=Lasiosphaeris hirsuta TaxID=260670 RepID=A0AA40BB59_9PEZI|nr:hypothetical protein B0H67DRAFT_57729 [Lasiosphaeris hirsuta]